MPHRAIALAAAIAVLAGRAGAAEVVATTGMIADLIDVTGEARAVELARRLGVTNATVNTTVNRLVREGLVRRERYRSIFLTDAGRRLAETARDRHGAVRDFLMALGVDRETAEIDAEGIEHHTSERTLEALRRFLAGRGGQGPG